MSAAGTLLAAVSIDGGYVAGFLVVWGITQIVSGGISAYVATRVLQAQTRELASRVAEIRSDLQTHHQEMERLESAQNAEAEARASCALDASRRYVDRQEYVRMIGTSTAYQQSISAKLDDVAAAIRKSISHAHDRITHNATAIAAFRGAGGQEAP